MYRPTSRHLSITAVHPVPSPVSLRARLTLTCLAPRGVFIPTQIVNFVLVPQHLRFMTISVVSLVWGTSVVPTARIRYL